MDSTLCLRSSSDRVPCTCFRKSVAIWLCISQNAQSCSKCVVSTAKVDLEGSLLRSPQISSCALGGGLLPAVPTIVIGTRFVARADLNHPEVAVGT